MCGKNEIPSLILANLPSGKWCWSWQAMMMMVMMQQTSWSEFTMSWLSREKSWLCVVRSSVESWGGMKGWCAMESRGSAISWCGVVVGRGSTIDRCTMECRCSTVGWCSVVSWGGDCVLLNSDSWLLVDINWVWLRNLTFVWLRNMNLFDNCLMKW